MTLCIERRRPTFTRDLMLRVALAWILISALLIVTNLGAILAYRFPDPDDVLRLVQVRALIDGQNWFDLAQHRAGGTVMHWSRLVDLPIATIILALRGFVGQPAAEMVALIAMPLLTLLVCLTLLGRIAWRLLGEEIAFFACLAFAFSVPVLEQLRPMRIDHHGWQIALVLLALNGLMARSPRIGGWIVGGALATALAISLEQMPIAAAFMAILGWRWLTDRSERGWLVHSMQALAVVSALLFAATHRLSGAAEVCDAIAPVHLAIFGWGALVLTGTAALEPRPRAVVFAGFALAGIGALAIVSQIAPTCTNGAFVALDPLSRALWYDRIREGLPIWHQALPSMLQIVIPPAIALVAAIRLAGRFPAWLRRWWTEYAVLLATVLVLSIFVARAGAVAGALSALPLGWQLREWLRAVRHRQRPMRRAMVYGGMAVALVPAAPALLLVSAVPGQAQYGQGTAHAPEAGECGISSFPATLAALPRGTALVPLDVAPAVLRDTDQSVLATGHHRAPEMSTVIRAFTSGSDAAHAIVTREGIDYVALCPSVGEPYNYALDAPDGLADQLLDRDTPGWLAPIRARDDGWLVWRVRR